MQNAELVEKPMKCSFDNGLFDLFECQKSAAFVNALKGFATVTQRSRVWSVEYPTLLLWGCFLNGLVIVVAFWLVKSGLSLGGCFPNGFKGFASVTQSFEPRRFHTWSRSCPSNVESVSRTKRLLEPPSHRLNRRQTRVIFSAIDSSRLTDFKSI